MWPTVDGLRQLEGDEAVLVEWAIESAIERVKESESESMSSDEFVGYGIDWFDQWDVGQRLWLLQSISRALLTRQAPPRPAAMWEATIDVVFQEVLLQIEQEMDQGDHRWRRAVLAALGRDELPPDDLDLTTWRTKVTQLADRILSVPGYQKAESYRDQDPSMLRRFLQQRGLPEDFLEQIPPLVR